MHPEALKAERSSRYIGITNKSSFLSSPRWVLDEAQLLWYTGCPEIVGQH